MIAGLRALAPTLVVLALLTAESSPAAQAQAPADPATIAAATQAAQVWLAFVDGRDYSQSWEAAAPVLQEAVTKAAWTQAVTQARGPLEPFGPRTLLGAQYTTSLPKAPPGSYVVLQYRTKVSQGREVVETIVPMLQPDGSWRVSGYYVRPAS